MADGKRRREERKGEERATLASGHDTRLLRATLAL